MPDIWLYSNSLSLYFMGQYNIALDNVAGGEYFLLCSGRYSSKVDTGYSQLRLDPHWLGEGLPVLHVLQHLVVGHPLDQSEVSTAVT